MASHCRSRCESLWCSCFLTSRMLEELIETCGWSSVSAKLCTPTRTSTSAAWRFKENWFTEKIIFQLPVYYIKNLHFKTSVFLAFLTFVIFSCNVLCIDAWCFIGIVLVLCYYATLHVNQELVPLSDTVYGNQGSVLESNEFPVPQALKDCRNVESKLIFSTISGPYYMMSNIQGPEKTQKDTCVACA